MSSVYGHIEGSKMCPDSLPARAFNSPRPKREREASTNRKLPCRYRSVLIGRASSIISCVDGNPTIARSSSGGRQKTPIILIAPRGVCLRACVCACSQSLRLDAKLKLPFQEFMLKIGLESDNSACENSGADKCDGHVMVAPPSVCVFKDPHHTQGYLR